MAEYIDREAAKSAVCNHWLDSSRSLDAINNIYAADVAPVVHGHWFFTEYEFFTCSACGNSYYNGAQSTAQANSYLNRGHVYKYCPNCGARMDENEEDNHADQT